MLDSGFKSGLPKKPKSGKFWNISERVGRLEAAADADFELRADLRDEIDRGHRNVALLPKWSFES